MKRTVAVLLGALALVALFVALVYAVLVAGHVSEPAATTVQGLTLRRVWATVSAVVALAGLVAGGVALRRHRATGIRPSSGRPGAIVALVAGLLGTANGGLNLAVASAGPGSGNGVVGGATAVVLGLIAVALGSVGLVRAHRVA